MRAGFFYRRLASPLHAARPGVALLWTSSLIAAVLALGHPFLLVALLAALLGAGAGAGVGRSLAGALRLSAVVWLPILIVNVIVSRQGLTVFARLGDLGPFGQGQLTVEAVVYGAILALKVLLLVLVTTLAGLAVDPDGALRIVRRLSFRSAVTASLAMRLVPVLGADARRLAEAQRTRPDGGPSGVLARAGLVRSIVAGSLDRAMDVAATLELRGYAAAPRAPRVQRPWSRHDSAFIASAVAVAALALVAGPGGAAAFDAYPQIHAAVGPSVAALAAALVAAVVLPFCDRRGIEP
jgi:energy-coupling factor transport system permease protein